MIRINKAERDYLVKNGVVCGENGISRTYSHNTSWYLCESRKNLSMLNSYRRSHTVETHE